MLQTSVAFNNFTSCWPVSPEGCSIATKIDAHNKHDAKLPTENCWRQYQRRKRLMVSTKLTFTS